ncbi:NXPE family member 3 [Holothuria leucospilota]|uniref:NXPE family member 3 n=1 Tax=Holothuria leucospilota TaxID=206669 RepID=A0A9Q1H4E0_HOLLE|nr:NXPE family member 3 [Holothuria leucospilota]
MEYRHHGLPIRNNWTWIRDIRYIANELDSLKGGDDVIVTLSLWAHFTATSFSFYEQRLRSIKEALNRLWDRAPGTTVVIKGANTRGHSGLSYGLYASDWFAYHLEHILREVFRNDKRIGYLDVWDMTTADLHPDVIHPPAYFVANVVNRLLTYICKR